MTDKPENNPSPEGDEPKTTEDVDLAVPLPGKRRRASKSSRFFVRGLATLLPAVLTLWLLVFAYGFVRDKIAAPINWGVQGVVIQFTDWPTPSNDDFADVWQRRSDYFTAAQEQEWEIKRDKEREALADVTPPLTASTIESILRDRRLDWMKDQPEIVLDARRVRLEKKWNSIAIGNWHVLDLIGLIIAIILFYFAGALVSNVIGRQLKYRGEKLIDRVPLIRRVYPAVKQVTDFFFGDGEAQIKFNRVVAVEYPRKGLYSVGLVTGDTMKSIEKAMGTECLTVFVPSSPTPFTGYVITVPAADTIDLGISIEDALKFAVSGGVLVPPAQLITRGKPNTEEGKRVGNSVAGSASEDADAKP